MDNDIQQAIGKSLMLMSNEQLEAVFTVAKILSLGDSEDTASHDLLAMATGKLALRGYFTYQINALEDKIFRLAGGCNG